MAKSPRTTGRDGPTANGEVAAFIEEVKSFPSGDHVIHGMVKAADTPDGIMFAHAGDCENWVFLPATSMVAARAAGQVRCAGHFHMLADIQLKDPEGDSANLFATLAHIHRLNLAQVQQATSDGCGPGGKCPPGQHCGPDGFGGTKCLPGPF